MSADPVPSTHPEMTPYLSENVFDGVRTSTPEEDARRAERVRPQLDLVRSPPAGRKDDTGKTPWGLLPYDAIRAILSVLAFGARKYEPRNWELGMDWSRPFDALMRHMTAWWHGEKHDPETGYSHLWHAGACILFLIAYEMRGVGTDNRPPRIRQSS